MARPLRTLFAIVGLAGLFASSVRSQESAPVSSPEQFESLTRRYETLLLRQPRRGTAFDQLYRLYLDAGRVDELAARFEKLAIEQPEKSAAQLLKGLIAERRGRDEDALAAFRKAESLDANDFYPPYCEGTCLAEQGRYEDAITALRRALKKSPPRAELVEIHKSVGRLHSRLGQTADALKAWSELAEAFPDDRLALEELAALLAEERQPEEAIKYYQKLADLSKADAYKRLIAQVEIGQLQVAQGKLKTAIASFDECLAQVEPDSWMARDIRRRVEEIFLRSDDATGLVEYYKHRLEQQPDDLNAMTRLAATLSRLGQRDEALKSYRGAIAKAPTRKDLREALIAELATAERFGEALVEAEALVKIAPKDPDALRRLGELILKEAGVEKRSEAEPKAFAVWKRIADARPEEPGSAVQLAELCRQHANIPPRAGDAAKQPVPQGVLVDAALDAYRAAVTRTPAATQYHVYLGEYLYALRRDQDALAAWKAMAEPPRDTADNLKQLAETLNSAGFLTEARDAAKHAIAKADDRHDLHLLAADLAEKAKDYAAALAHVDAMARLADSEYLEEQALARKVQIYASSGQLGAEAARLAKLVEPADAKAKDLWIAAEFALAERKSQEAIGMLDRALERAPKDVRLLKLKARAHAEAGDLSGSAAQYRKLADAEPKNRVQHLQELIRILHELGRPNDAEQAATELIKASPARADGYLTLAEVQFRRNELDAGLDTLRRALRVDPRNIEVRQQLARKLAEAQRIDEAIEHYYRAFEQVDEIGAKIGLAGTLADLHLINSRFGALVDRLKQARRQQEDPFALTLCLVEAYRRAEDFDSARRELNELVRKRPSDVSVLSLLVDLAESMQDIDEAIASQKKLVDLAPERANLEKLATLYQRAGKREDAAGVFVRLAREAKDPDSVIAAIDRARTANDDELAIALASAEWSKRPDDWRFGLRLAESRWRRGDHAAAARVFEAIAKLPASDKYEKNTAARPQIATSATRSGPAVGIRNYPPIFYTFHLLNQTRAAATNTDARASRALSTFSTHNAGNDSLDRSQLVSAIYLHVFAREQKTEAAWIDALKNRSKTDIQALRSLAWVFLSENKIEDALLYVDEWINRSPNEVEPRVARFQYTFYRNKNEQAQPPADESKRRVEILLEQAAWFEKNRPEVAFFLRGSLYGTLVGQGMVGEAKAYATERIKAMTDVAELQQLLAYVGQFQDPDLVALVQGKAEEFIKKLGPGAAQNGTAILSSLSLQGIQSAVAKRDWENALAAFDGYFASSHPSSIKPQLSATNAGAFRSTSVVYAQNPVFSSNVIMSRAMGVAGRFPQGANAFGVLSAYVDQNRLTALSTTYQALKTADSVTDLMNLLDKRSEESEGIARVCWRLARVQVLWWENDRKEAVERIAELVKASPADNELRMMLVHAYAASGDVPKALAALEPVNVPFGRAAKPVEQLRLQLAMRASNNDVAKQAALRLFGMRLDANEQVELARTLDKLGLSTQSQQLSQRAEHAAKSNPALLVGMMAQALPTDPKKAAELARSVLQHVGRSNTPNDYNHSLRLQALLTLKQTGELSVMIAKTEQQLAASPKSLNLLEDLAEYHTAAGDDAAAQAILQRMLDARPDDPQLRYRLAQQLFRRRKFADGIALLGPVWEKDPSLVLQQSYNLGRYYIRAGQVDLLIEHMRKLKNSPTLTQQYWQLQNLVQNLGHNNEARVKDILKLYQAVLELTPAEQRPNTEQQYAQLLLQKNLKPEALRLYKRQVFPDKSKAAIDQTKQEPAKAAIPSGLTTPAIALRPAIAVSNASSGLIAKMAYPVRSAPSPVQEFTTTLMLVADLAEQTKSLDALTKDTRETMAEQPEWSVKGELLLAMIDRRKGDEKPLAAFGAKVLANESLGGKLEPELPSLLEELGRCESKPALEAALALRDRIRKKADATTPAAMPDFAALQSQARILIKLGERDRARELLREVSARPDPTGLNPQSLAQFRYQFHSMLGPCFQQLGFPLDALARYATLLRDVNAPGNVFGFPGNPTQRVGDGPSVCIQDVLKSGLDEAVSTLEAALDPAAPEPDSLNAFFVVLDPMVAQYNEPWQYSHDWGESSTSQRPVEQLLPAVLTWARGKNRLSRIAELAAARLSHEPADVRLQSLSVLVALAEEKPANAAPILDSWLKLSGDKDRKKREIIAAPEVWLAVQPALKFAEPRAAARRLADAIAASAHRLNNPGRQQAVLVAVVESMADDADPAAADKLLDALIEEKKGDAETTYTVAKVYFERRRPERAVALLEQLWRGSPDFLLRKLAEVAALYAQSDRPAALAKGLRLIPDHNLAAQFGWPTFNTLNQIAGRARRESDAAELLHAALDVMPENTRSYAASQLTQFIDNLPRNGSALKILRDFSLPSANCDGHAFDVVGMRLADLAKELNYLKEIEEQTRKAMSDHASWRAQGEFQLALLKRRQGDEKPLVALGEKLRADPAYAKVLNPARRAIRLELEACESPESHKLALELVAADATANSGGAIIPIEAARILAKLGKSDDARASLLAALRTPLAGAMDESNYISQELNRHTQVAAQLASMNLRLDAIGVLASLLDLDTSGVPSGNDYVFHNLTQAVVMGRNETKRLLDKDADASLLRLEKLAAATTSKDDFAAFGAAFDSPTDFNPNGGSPQAEGANDEPLLIGLLAHARNAKKIDALATQVETALKSGSEDASRLALLAAIELVREREDEAAAILKKLAERVRANSADALAPMVWIAAREGLKSSRTREPAAAIAESVAVAASEKGQRHRVLAIVNALAERAGNDAAVLLIDRLNNGSAGREPDAALAYQAGVALLRKKQVEPALKLLDSAWSVDPRLMLQRFHVLAPLYFGAGQSAALVRAVRGITDSSGNAQPYFEITNWLGGAANGEKDEAGIIALYRAVAEVQPNQRDSALGGLANYYAQKGRKGDSLGVLKELVLSPSAGSATLSSQASELLRLGKELNQLPEIGKACRETTAKQPSWKPFGELLLAMIARREGDEQPLASIGQKLNDDPAFAAAIQSASHFATAELAECRSRPALETARDLIQEELRQRWPNRLGGSDGRVSRYELLARVFEKLADHKSARAALVQAAAVAESAAVQSGSPQQAAIERDRLALALAKLGFAADAIRLRALNLELPLSATRYLGPRPEDWRAEQRKQLRALIVEAMTAKRAETLSALENELRSTPRGDLAGYFVALDSGWSKEEQTALPAELIKPNEARVQLLSVLIAHAKASGQLDELADAVKAARKRAPDDPQLVALEILVALARGEKSAATEVQAWQSRLERSPEHSVESPTWLLIQAALRDPNAREAGRSLLFAAFETAGQLGDEQRQAALLDACDSPDDWDRLRSTHEAELKRALDTRATGAKPK